MGKYLAYIISGFEIFVNGFWQTSRTASTYSVTTPSPKNGVDSADQSDNEVCSFLNIINEFYEKMQQKIEQRDFTPRCST